MVLNSGCVKRSNSSWDRASRFPPWNDRMRGEEAWFWYDAGTLIRYVRSMSLLFIVKFAVSPTDTPAGRDLVHPESLEEIPGFLEFLWMVDADKAMGIHNAHMASRDRDGVFDTCILKQWDVNYRGKWDGMDIFCVTRNRWKGWREEVK